MSLTTADVDDFRQFALELIDREDVTSLEECVRRWGDRREYNETVEAIREGLADAAAGRSQPVEEAFADIRRELGLPEHRRVS